MSESNVQTRSQGPPKPQQLLDKIECESHIAILRDIVEKIRAEKSVPLLPLRSPNFSNQHRDFFMRHPTSLSIQWQRLRPSVMNCSRIFILTLKRRSSVQISTLGPTSKPCRGCYPSNLRGRGPRPNSTISPPYNNLWNFCNPISGLIIRLTSVSITPPVQTAASVNNGSSSVLTLGCTRSFSKRRRLLFRGLFAPCRVRPFRLGPALKATTLASLAAQAPRAGCWLAELAELVGLAAWNQVLARLTCACLSADETCLRGNEL
jgi:hypothetical protein